MNELLVVLCFVKYNQPGEDVRLKRTFYVLVIFMAGGLSHFLLYGKLSWRKFP